MRLTAHGHPAIRATHSKTLELIHGDDLTERGTCVIGAHLGRDDLPPAAGPIRITVTAGGHEFALDARGNSAWHPSLGAVVRRGPLKLHNTFAAHATAAAGDLPRDLVAAMAGPDAEIVLIVDALPETEPHAVLCNPTAVSPQQLGAEVGAADAVVVEDAGAAAFVKDHDRPTTNPPPRPIGRLLVLGTGALPGRTVDLTGWAVETVGLAPQLAAAAALPGHPPLTFDGDLSRTPADHGLVLMTDRARLPRLLARARDIRGTTAAVVARPHTDPVMIETAHPPDLPGTTDMWCALLPTTDRLDPDVLGAITGLLAAGVATRPAADALAALTGWPRRRAYDEVLRLAADAAG